MTAASTPLRRVGISVAAIVTLLLLLAVAIPQIASGLDPYAYVLLIDQDILVAPLFVLACFVGASPTPESWLHREHRELWFVLLAMLAVAVLCWAGHYIIFRGLDLTRDEQMVWFDAGIFRDGALVSPIPVEWRELANALNRKFMLPIGAAEAWVSAYLPINAALHAAAGALVDEDLASPLCVAAGGVFLWRISLQLWPDDRTARLVVFLLYLTSSQILITGMTKYSMSAHMAFNLAWLWLFLRHRTSSHALAMVVGFFATGLHQPIFHPMFALPFVLWLAARRDWRLFVAYGVAYATILAFWLAWPSMMTSFGTGPVVATTTVQQVTFFERFAAAFAGLSLEGVWLTCVNLVRFVTWQHPLLPLLLAFGIWSSWRTEPLVRVLTASVVLPIVVVWLVLPWQGNGWGYRYLHPALGSAILLGGWGWHALTQQGIRLKQSMIWTTAIAAFVLFPLRALMVYQSTAPFARSEHTIAGVDADFAIVDGRDTEFVINRHDLSNRPIRMIAQEISLRRMADLCRRRSVAFVEGQPPRPVSAWVRALKAEAVASGCKTETVAVPMGLLRRWKPSLDLH